MYCQNCGHQNPNNTNFCQNCGSRLNAVNVQQNNGGILKTKEEYMKDYRAKHPEILFCTVISLLFDIVGFLVIIFKITSLSSKSYMSSADKESLTINIVIAVLLFIVGTIFLTVGKTREKKGLQEYENYYLVNYSNNNVKSVSLSANGWTCQKCGMNNTSSSSICGNCGSSRPGSVRHTASDNEWKCPSCGRINQNYVGTCGCGARKP